MVHSYGSKSKSILSEKRTSGVRGGGPLKSIAGRSKKKMKYKSAHGSHMSGKAKLMPR